jgi:hypothetical protein
MSPHITPDPLSPPRFPDEEFDQQPRHTVLVEWDGDDVLMTLECPFGTSTYASAYPTIEDIWAGSRRGRGISFTEAAPSDTFRSASGWPARLGQHTEGYCSMDLYVRALYVFECRGAVIHMQHIASSQCVVEYEAEQVGLEDLLEENTAFLQPGRYPIVFWSDGWGESYSCGIEVEHSKRVPLD